MSVHPLDVVPKFERLINARDPAAIAGLLTTDAVVVDSLGTRVQGREKLRAAWEGYFKMVPDYSISHEEIFSRGNTVAVFGTARGTFSPDGQIRKENFWTTPAAWRAWVKDGKITLWQVFADNEPIRAIMWRTGRGGGEGGRFDPSRPAGPWATLCRPLRGLDLSHEALRQETIRSATGKVTSRSFDDPLTRRCAPPSPPRGRGTSHSD